jgi:DNA modification methylase
MIEREDEMHIEDKPIHELKKRQTNARTHSKRQIRQLADSIKRFGFTNPVLVDDAYEIIAGHGRYDAAILLGLSTIPVIRLSHLNPVERRAYVLADNQLALKAGWDRELLALELHGLQELGFDTEIIGFSTAEADLILEGLQEASGDDKEDTVISPGSGPIVSRPGDLWVLGKHRLICGDARVGPVYERLMGADVADLVFSDPPYNVPIDGHVSGNGQVVHREFAMATGEMDSTEFIRFLSDTLGKAVERSRQGAVHYVCMDWRHLSEILAVGKQLYSSLLNLCVWNKSNAGMGSFYRSKHELVLVFKAGQGPHENTVELGRHGRNRTNVWDYPGANGFSAHRASDLATHPTVKPVALVADVIKDASRRSQIVLDPFCGSGTTIIAAEKTGRRALGLEIDPAYVDATIQRWQGYTGKSARLADNELSFEDVSTERGASC